MTEPDAYTPPTEPVVPEGKDPLDNLKVQELSIVGKQLKLDPYAAVHDPQYGIKWEALATVAWVWAKRIDPRAKLAPFLELEPGDIAMLLRQLDDDEGEDQGEDQAGGDDLENPTDSPRA